jgi:hypothetical protein
VIDLVETAYETEEGNALIVRLVDETTGFGTRHAGGQLRTKCTNLLNADVAKPLILDWTDVPLVSSSFADQFVGKLFVELGPLAFRSRPEHFHGTLGPRAHRPRDLAAGCTGGLAPVEGPSAEAQRPHERSRPPPIHLEGVVQGSRMPTSLGAEIERRGGGSGGILAVPLPSDLGRRWF